MPAPPVVLSIAGFDPSSGAGITADIKTIAAHGCYGVTCITALTVQSTRGVQQVSPLPAKLVSATLTELATDLRPAAVRIGMLGGGEIAEVVAEFLERYSPDNVVLDPILRSSSGADLLDQAALAVLRTRLLSLADVITPNLDEAAALTGLQISTPGEMRAAAECLHGLGARTVVVKGGHLQGSEIVEVLSIREGKSLSQTEFHGLRQTTRATHGTGCAFATALACNLARGRSVADAVAEAKEYVSSAMAHAYQLGSGAGPMHHLYRLDAT